MQQLQPEMSDLKTRIHDLGQEMEGQIKTLTRSPLQQEWAHVYRCTPQDLFNFITNVSRLNEWMPFIADSSLSQTTRKIKSWGGVSNVEEFELHKEFPLYCYTGTPT